MSAANERMVDIDAIVTSNHTDIRKITDAVRARSCIERT
jgi:hypothetical protein